LNRRLLLFLGLSLVIVVVASLILYIGSLPSFSSPDSQSILWQTPIPHFATSFTIADGKVFVTDDWAYVQCYDENTGESIWNTSLHYPGYGDWPKVTVYEGKVYASTGEGRVKRLNEDTGAVEMEYQAPLRDPVDYKRVPSFLVADGKVFATYAGIAVYDAETGQQLWAVSPLGEIVNSTSVLLKSDFVYIPQGNPIQRVDPNDGTVTWIFPGSADDKLVFQEQVVLWNYGVEYGYPHSGYTVVCLDINTGQELWRFDPGTLIFQPTASSGLLLFGARDGYFYALNMSDGSVKWKTYIDDSGLIQTYNSYHSLSEQPSSVSLTASEPLIDSPNERIFWSVFSHNIFNTINEPSNNSGVVMSLNLQNGDKEWYNPFNNSLIYQLYGQSMALLNDELFVTGSTAVYCLKASTGDVLWERNFDHQLLNPLLADNKVFVVADLYVIAYR
jgi:outer membrane protein assembly factor BamB